MTTNKLAQCAGCQHLVIYREEGETIRECAINPAWPVGDCKNKEVNY